MIWLHLAVTWSLVGLIWTIQLVHYPLMARVERGFARYADEHRDRIVWLVGPLMGLELVTASVLAFEPPTGLALECRIGAALVVVIWLVTGLAAVPLHSVLARGYDARAIQQLVRVNWIRTVTWTLRGWLAIEIASVAG